MADKTVAVISDGAWQANTAYSLGDTVSNDSLKIYKCITAGTSAASGGPTGTGTDITDNTVHWAYQETVGAAYTSLNAALSGESANLITNTCRLTIDCYNFLDTTQFVSGAGFTTSKIYDVIIRAHDSHVGKYSTSSYRVSVFANTMDISHFEFCGIQFINPSDSDTNHLLIVGASRRGIIDSCIFKGNGYNSDTLLIMPYDSWTFIFNSIFYDSKNGGTGSHKCAARFEHNVSKPKIFNCTFQNCNTAIYSSTTDTGNAILKRCLFASCTTDLSGSLPNTYCATTNDSTKGLNGSGTGNRFSQTLTFVDVDGDDFHLASSDTGALDQGGSPDIYERYDAAPHDMTANTSLGFVASASSEANELNQAYDAFNEVLEEAQGWTANATTGWLKIDLVRSYKIYGYSIREKPSQETLSPKAWTLQGSNDDSNWTTIDTKTNETGWGSAEERYFTCDTYTTSYRYFKIDITENNGHASYVAIEELKLFYDLYGYYDIDGQTRSGTWDIGADEYVSGVIAGTTCWGHSTGVTEVNTRTFATNWTGTGRVVGSGDSEKILLSTGQYMESEVVQIGGTIIYTKDKYQSGYGSITMKYRTGATQVACEAASYSTYTVPVASSGYFQVRFEA